LADREPPIAENLVFVVDRRAANRGYGEGRPYNALSSAVRDLLLRGKEKAVLFITNGDSAAGRIGASGLEGEILPWRDVLHEGPVPGGPSPEELADVRARFLAERGWTSLANARRDFARRDATLAGYGDHEEVVLFFEHDLYDQLQLIQVLDWFSGRDLEGTRLSIVQTDEYVGTLGPERLLALFHDRRETTTEQFALASMAPGKLSARPTRPRYSG
jgi:hypothetical protein